MPLHEKVGGAKMDFNGDGKHDWKDHADLYNINQMANEDGAFGQGYGRRKSGTETSPLATGVIVITAILCIVSLVSGAAEAIEGFLAFGTIAFFIAQWLSH